MNFKEAYSTTVRGSIIKRFAMGLHTTLQRFNAQQFRLHMPAVLASQYVVQVITSGLRLTRIAS